jgi:DNA polymerase-3 subunit beta
MALDPARGLVTISVDAQDVGSGSEQLPADTEGEPMEIAFNVRYLLEGLKAIGTDRVRLQCNAPTTPAVLSPAGNESDYTYLVMPVQIRT